MKTPIEYSDKVVAFIDILGFSNLITALSKDSKLHERLHYALSHIHSYASRSKAEDNSPSQIRVSVFSDCIAISAATNNHHSVIWASGWIQSELLGVGILTRGGISVGKIFHSDGLLYGEGMIRAYNIEKSAAVYPRIVLDPVLVQQIPKEYLEVFLEKDTDGLWFVNPFALNGSVGDVDALLEDGWDPHDVYLEEVEKHIENGLNDAVRVDHISKWTWMKIKHSIAMGEYKRTRQTKLSSMMAEGERRRKKNQNVKRSI